MSHFWVSTQICGPDLDLISKSIKNQTFRLGKAAFRVTYFSPSPTKPETLWLLMKPSQL